MRRRYKRPDPIAKLVGWLFRSLWRALVWALTYERIPDFALGERPTEAAIKLFYKSREWRKIAYRVKKKRGRTCECCGARAPNVTIVTDHVKSLRNNWHLRLDPNNLQVLCEGCNLGKGSNDYTDFRRFKSGLATRMMAGSGLNTGLWLIGKGNAKIYSKD